MDDIIQKWTPLILFCEGGTLSSAQELRLNLDSGVIPHSAQGEQMGFGGLNLGWAYVRQTRYLPYYDPGSYEYLFLKISFFIFIFFCVSWGGAH